MLSSTWFEKGFVLKNCGVSGAREGGYLLYLSSTFFILSIDMVDTEIY